MPKIWGCGGCGELWQSGLTRDRQAEHLFQTLLQRALLGELWTAKPTKWTKDAKGFRVFRAFSRHSCSKCCCTGRFGESCKMFR